MGSDTVSKSTVSTSPISTAKHFMFVNRRAPHGTIYPQESLDLVMITAAFDQQVSLVFMDDGVYQLKSGQDPSGLAMKNFAKTFRALADFDIEDVYVEAESLASRGLLPEDLVIPVTVLSSDDLGKLMSQQDVVITS